MVKIGICDDNNMMLVQLNTLISEQFSECHFAFELSVFDSGKAFIEAHTVNSFDVCFLDIAMPDMTGFEVAKVIRKENRKTLIIFITTENNLVYDSFTFQPFYFIPKMPEQLMISRLHLAIAKIKDYFETYKKIQLNLPYGECVFMEFSDIIKIKSDRNYVEYYTIKGVIRLRENLDKTLESLSTRIFARVHNRIVVNMSNIKHVTFANNTILFNDESEECISRSYKVKFTESYYKYLQDFG